ncbi:MAG: dihydroorotate dehydrogenase electron transfer subunit [Promethearchaeota archaeon]
MTLQTKIDKPYTTKIKKIIINTPKIRTYKFNFAPTGIRTEISPGQFLMVWIPGVDEIPMSVSFIGEDTELGITVKNTGDATNKLHQLKEGDYIGVRGPYGSGFKYFEANFSVVIGGGVGIASLRELILKINNYNPGRLLMIMGAQNKQELLYLPEFLNIFGDSMLKICTDDGSSGFHGFIPDYFEQHISEICVQAGSPEQITVYSCGPEMMMKKVFGLCEKYGIKMQASLERMMRCGFGLCGLCVLDPLGVKVCQDGPVFESKILRKIEDFGKNKRTITGEKIKE